MSNSTFWSFQIFRQLPVCEFQMFQIMEMVANFSTIYPVIRTSKNLKKRRKYCKNKIITQISAACQAAFVENRFKDGVIFRPSSNAPNFFNNLSISSYFAELRTTASMASQAVCVPRSAWTIFLASTAFDRYAGSAKIFRSSAAAFSAV